MSGNTGSFPIHQNSRRETNTKHVEHIVPMGEHGVSHAALAAALRDAAKEYQELTGGAPVPTEAIRVVPSNEGFIVWFRHETHGPASK